MQEARKVQKNKPMLSSHEQPWVENSGRPLSLSMIAAPTRVKSRMELFSQAQELQTACGEARLLLEVGTSQSSLCTVILLA